MLKPLMRIPYTGPLPPPRIVPESAHTFPGAVLALARFLAPAGKHGAPSRQDQSAVILSGAGISVASGLADYRGANGTYTQNKSYRPIYYNEFVNNHQARRRYWARSFLGWITMHTGRPNAAHYAIRELGEMGLVSSVVTQNVDSFHSMAHPSLPTIELHGFLRSLVCLTCGNYLSRSEFQNALAKLNPPWAALLADVLASGALGTENPAERRARGLKANPDGDVDLPDAPYSSFRYPPCPVCLQNPPPAAVAGEGPPWVEVDQDGAWLEGSTAGILKPAVIMFGESIAEETKTAAENTIDDAGRLLVVGSSLATYSAWRLARRAKQRGIPVAILNLGGVRGEEELMTGSAAATAMSVSYADAGVRIDMKADELLPEVVRHLRS